MIAKQKQKSKRTRNPLWSLFGGQWTRRARSSKAKLTAYLKSNVKLLRDFLLGPKVLAVSRYVTRLSRALQFESLEPRQLLTGGQLTLAQYLTNMTPVPHTSGDMPADVSLLVPMSTFSPAMSLPDVPSIPDLHAFVTGYAALQTGVEDNTTERPAAWGEMAADDSYEYRVHLDDNGMAVTNWAINWGDGSPLDRVSSGPWTDHAYSGPGQYDITIVAYTGYGSFAFDTTGTTPAAIVANLAPADVALHVTNDPDTFVNQSFSLTGYAAFSFPNPGLGNSTNFSYDLDWGDGVARAEILNCEMR